MSGLGDENGVEKGTGERETMKTVLTSEVRVGVTRRKLAHRAPKVTMTVDWQCQMDNIKIRFSLCYKDIT